MAELSAAAKLKLNVSDDNYREIAFYRSADVHSIFEQERKQGAITLVFRRWNNGLEEWFFAPAYPVTNFGGDEAASIWDNKTCPGSPLYISIPDASTRKHKIYRVLERWA